MDCDAVGSLDSGRSGQEFQEAFGGRMQGDLDGQGGREESPSLDRSQDGPLVDRSEACGPFQDGASWEASLGSRLDVLAGLLVAQEEDLPVEDLPDCAAQVQRAWLRCAERLARPAREFDYDRLLEAHRSPSRRDFREAYQLSFAGVDGGRASFCIEKRL